MKILSLSAGLAALSLGIAMPAGAETPGGAEKLRRLDIMLMVTSLRCRNTADSFTEEYRRFTSSHITELNQASAELRRELASNGANDRRALDRISTTMANRYGQGHPWLSCAELKAIAGDLASSPGRGALESAAGLLLGDSDPTRLAVAQPVGARR